MDRSELGHFILQTYHVAPDHPWFKYPHYAVFRHSSNRKWFALIMDVPRSKLGLPGATKLDIVNLKSDPLLIGSLRNDPGIFPAYHMSKDHWVTIALDGSVPADQIKALLKLSYAQTA